MSNSTGLHVAQVWACMRIARGHRIHVYILYCSLNTFVTIYTIVAVSLNVYYTRKNLSRSMAKRIVITTKVKVRTFTTIIVLFNSHPCFMVFSEMYSVSKCALAVT